MVVMSVPGSCSFQRVMVAHWLLAEAGGETAEQLAAAHDIEDQDAAGW